MNATATVSAVQDHQRAKDGVVGALRRDVSCMPMRRGGPVHEVSSGNRKIQTMSTKCQYRPAISTGVYHSGVKRFLCAIT